ncbi:MAG: aryl-sulfate sulfotransferase [Candidatus Thorarchaeota archaeon]
MSSKERLLWHRRLLLVLLLIILIQPATPAMAEVLQSPSFHMAEIMRGEVEVTKTQAAFEGYNAFVLRERDIENRQNNQTLIICDMDGNVHYERILTNSSVYELADLSMDFVSPTTLLVGYPFNVALVNLYTGTTRYLNCYGHHEYEYNPNNDTVFTFKYNQIVIDNATYLFDLIHEYDLNGNLVWSLDVSEFIRPDMGCPYGDLFGGYQDITHSNTLFYDADEDMIYYNPRNVNTFYKIDHKTGEVIWGLGEYGNFTMYDSLGVEVDHLFFHPHSLERVDDNTFILFDNDHHNQNFEGSHKSRMIEITIDEVTMEAHLTWVWRGTDIHWSFLWGDADRLPNGNRLGVFGAASRPGYEHGAHLIEVTEEGDIAWQFTFRTNELYRYGVYRIERFRYAPILLSPTQLHFEPEEEVVLQWQTFYNYRPRKTVEGNFTFSNSTDQLDSGAFLYDRFWRPALLSFNLGVLEPGEHEYTLEIENDIGQKTNDTVIVDVSVLEVPFPLPILGASILIIGIIAVMVVFMKRG